MRCLITPLWRLLCCHRLCWHVALFTTDLTRLLSQRDAFMDAFQMAHYAAKGSQKSWHDGTQTQDQNSPTIFNNHVRHEHPACAENT
jgi:hypothetical protein